MDPGKQLTTADNASIPRLLARSTTPQLAFELS
jgi:hypothetical protein